MYEKPSTEAEASSSERDVRSPRERPAFKVSVVLPTYQRAEFLGSTIASLLGQSLRSVELIVMDDGSTDATSDVVAQAESSGRVRYVRRQHLGIPQIVNEGMALATGEYVAICHDHDLYDTDFLRSLATALDIYPSAAFAHCGVSVIDSEGLKETARFVYNYAPLERGRSFLVDQLLPGIACPVAGLSMIRRSALGNHFLEPDYGPVADVELWLRLSAIGDVAYLQGPLIKIRERDPSSEFYRRGLELAQLTLKAKRKYLHYAPAALQAKIERRWRKEVDRVAFAACWRALEERRNDALRLAQSVLREEGTPQAALFARAMGSAPRLLAVAVFRLARGWVHGLRALGRLNRLGEA